MVTKMKNEYRLILIASLNMKTQYEIEQIYDLLETKLDWCEIAGQLFNHRLAGYFLLGLTKDQQKKIPRELRKAIELLIVAQRQQTIKKYEIIKPILAEFRKEKLRYAGLKGLIFNIDNYQMGIRRSNDIDLLVPELELSKLDEILRKFGYIQSFLPEGKLVEASKKQKLIQRMNYHDLVPYVKAIDNGINEIDINFIFDTKENEITQKIFNMELTEYKNDEYSVIGLPFETNLAFLCIHFFREGTNSLWTDGKRDVVLYKLVDIMNVIRKYKDVFNIEKWATLVKQLEIDHKCYYTFYMLAQFYPEDELLQKLLKLLEPVDKSYLFEVKIEGQNRIVKRTESFYDAAFNHIR